MRRRSILAILAVSSSWELPGQSVPARPSFEVASVKLNTINGQSDFTPRRSGDRVTMHNTTVYSVVSFAYHINAGYQVSWNVDIPDGGRWCDIEAIAPAAVSDDDLRLMFQSLLEERFKLKVHRETRELAAYDLVIAKSGSKLKAEQADSKITVDGRPIRAGTGAVAGGVDGLHLMGKGATMEQLVSSLSGRMSAPVYDHTGLTGIFDYNVVFSRDDNTSELATVPFLTTALEQELGLKLEKGKGPVEVLIVDHVEKPSAN